MIKRVTGLGSALFLNGYDMSESTTEIGSITITIAPQETHGLRKLWQNREQLLMDVSVALSGWVSFEEFDRYNQRGEIELFEVIGGEHASLIRGTLQSDNTMSRDQSAVFTRSGSYVGANNGLVPMRVSEHTENISQHTITVPKLAAYDGNYWASTRGYTAVDTGTNIVFTIPAVTEATGYDEILAQGVSGVWGPLPAPLGFTGTSPSAGRVELHWTTGSPSIYRYQYRTKEGSNDYGNWANIPSSDHTTNAHTFATVTAAEHTYQIRAVNAAGNGEESAEVVVTVT